MRQHLRKSHANGWIVQFIAQLAAEQPMLDPIDRQAVLAGHVGQA